MFMRVVSLCACVSSGLAGHALAVGGGDDSPPKPTETTLKCTDGQVWDAESKTCVEAQSELLDDDTRYRAVREFAYAGKFDAARAVLEAMREGDSDRVLTYRGFLARRTGDISGAMQLYRAALAQNPDNLLARAYMGLGLVEAGDTAAARVQLAEIRARGGTGTWPDLALERAIASGWSPNY